jgi:hypothetical protein
MMYYWDVDYPQQTIIRETRIDAETVSEWCEFFRDIAAEHFLSFNDQIGGVDSDGKTINVEIDESQFFKRKNNKGRIGSPIWVFGGIERYTRKCFLTEVDNMSRDTLMTVIFSRIGEGSRVISDKCAALGVFMGIIDMNMKR